MTSEEFNLRVIQCEKAYAITMPGVLVPVTRSTVLVWLNDALDQSTYKPNVRFHDTPEGTAVVVGFPVGQGEEVTP